MRALSHTGDDLRETDARAVTAANIVAKLLSMDAYVNAKSISIYLSMPKGEVMTRNMVENALATGKDVYVPFIDEILELDRKGRKTRSRKQMDMVALHSIEDLENCERRRDEWGIPSVSTKSLSKRIAILDPDYSKILHSDGHGSMDRTLSLASSKKRETSEAILDMIIMPGLAFDRQCRRLGHGRGFYDTFLETYRTKKVVCSDSNRPMPYIGKLYLRSCPHHEIPDECSVGVALNEQVLPSEESIPVHHYDWFLDALLTGDGSLYCAGVRQAEQN